MSYLIALIPGDARHDSQHGRHAQGPHRHGAAVFKAVHGSAPDLAGKGLANPTALILIAVLMLRYLRDAAAADRIENAVHQVYAAGETLTGDLGGKATTGQFVEGVLAAL